MAVRMENKDVQALWYQYTRPSTSLEVVRTVCLHAPPSLSSPFHSVLPSCLSDSYNLPLLMSESVGATNDPGSISRNASAADGQEPGSSARIDSLPAHIVQIKDSHEVCVFISRVRTDSTIQNCIG